MLTKLHTLFRRYRKNDSGVAAIETIMVVPLLAFAIVFCLTFFFAFADKGRANRANFVVADYLSRQENAVDEAYLLGLARLYVFLNNSTDVKMRVSAISYEFNEVTGKNEHDIKWSYGMEYPEMTDAMLQDNIKYLPIMSLEEVVLFVETERKWTPYFDVGVGKVDFVDRIAVKPRFTRYFDGPSGTYNVVMMDN